MRVFHSLVICEKPPSTRCCIRSNFMIITAFFFPVSEIFRFSQHLFQSNDQVTSLCSCVAVTLCPCIAANCAALGTTPGGGGWKGENGKGLYKQNFWIYYTTLYTSFENNWAGSWQNQQYRSNFREVDFAPAKNDKVNKVEKWQKLTAGLNPNHIHIFKPWKKRCAKLHKDRHEIV